MTRLMFALVAALSLMGISAASSFVNVPITSIANQNASNYYQNYPSGSQLFAGVPFQVEPNMFYTSEGGSNAGFPIHGDISTSVESPLIAHILIEGPSVTLQFAGMDLGYITFNYQNGAQQVFHLIVGETIRDWVTRSDLVVTTSNPAVTTVWHGSPQQNPWLSAGCYDAIINKLSIPLLQGSTLTSITFDDTSEITCNSAAPGFYINGITIEAVPEPSSILMLVCSVGGMIWRKRRNVA